MSSKKDISYKSYISTLTHQAITVLLMVIALILMGVTGYMYLEKWPFLDALYMTVITLATVGFKEVHTMNRAGEIFTMCLITSGVGVFTYGAATFSRLLVEGEFRMVFEKRRLKKGMRKLQNHVIVCGFGRLGEKICQDLKENGEEFVVIENDPDQISRLSGMGYLYVEADASDEDAMEEAGVKRAKALIAVVGSDSDNLFLTLSARELNPEIHIVTRVEDNASTKKLYKAGANRVLSPYDAGARMLANAALKPTISELMELSTRMGPISLRMEEAVVEEGSILDGVQIGKSRIREKTGAIVLALRRSDTSQIIRPQIDTKISGGDILVVVGSKEDLEKIKLLAKSKA